MKPVVVSPETLYSTADHTARVIEWLALQLSKLGVTMISTRNFDAMVSRTLTRFSETGTQVSDTGIATSAAGLGWRVLETQDPHWHLRANRLEVETQATKLLHLIPKTKPRRRTIYLLVPVPPPQSNPSNPETEAPNA